MPKIKRKKGDFHYKNIPLYLGVKRIDKKQAEENLSLFKKIADKHELKFFLAYGTLLGAVREGDFINHDEDIDLAILDDQRELLFELLEELQQNGFMVARWDRIGLLSIIRKGEYIDLYVFKYTGANIFSCGAGFLPSWFFENEGQILFKNEYFHVPNNPREALRFLYGPSWEVPVPYTDFNVGIKERIIAEAKEFLRHLIPSFLYGFLKTRATKKAEALYLRRTEKFKNMK